MNTRSPLILIVMNFVVGAMVARGVVQPNDHSSVVQILSDIVGYLIILSTTVISLYKIIKHKHPDEIQPTVVQSITPDQNNALKQIFTLLEQSTIAAANPKAEDMGTPASITQTTPSNTTPTN